MGGGITTRQLYSPVPNNETIVAIRLPPEMFRAKARPGNMCFNRPGLGPKINIKGMSIYVPKCVRITRLREGIRQRIAKTSENAVQDREYFEFPVSGDLAKIARALMLIFFLYNCSIGTFIFVKSYFNKLQLYLTT